MEEVGTTPRNEIEQVYLDYLEEGLLSTLFCDSCHRARFYPRSLCPYCHVEGGTWQELSGRGVLRTFTQVERPPDPGFVTPYVVGVVALEEGVSLMCRIEDATLEELSLGLAVRVLVRRFEPWDRPFPVAVPDPARHE